MTSVIVPQASRAYLRAVLSAVFRLLAIAGLILMPLGMGMTPAWAGSTHQMSAGGEGHCEGQPSDDGSKATIVMHCVAACTALLAETPSVQEPAEKPLPPLDAALVRSLVGATIPPATPPPRAG